MATNYITIKGYIRDGKIEVDLPENVVDGEVSLEVPITANAPDSTDYQPLTDEEIDALMHPNPKTGAEIVANLKKLQAATMGLLDLTMQTCLVFRQAS